MIWLVSKFSNSLGLMKWSITVPVLSELRKEAFDDTWLKETFLRRQHVGTASFVVQFLQGCKKRLDSFKWFCNLFNTIAKPMYLWVSWLEICTIIQQQIVFSMQNQLAWSCQLNCIQGNSSSYHATIRQNKLRFSMLNRL